MDGIHGIAEADTLNLDGRDEDYHESLGCASILGSLILCHDKALRVSVGWYVYSTEHEAHLPSVPT